ncbi:amidase [Sphingopyxis kveilinensis]|uniref:amidase n=1 Tax=Sphingopyxis kveilinensis TaxID=3114367 RepID=UPI0030D53874
MFAGKIWKLNATDIAAAVKRGDISAIEAVDAHLERIASVNPKVNAATQVMAQSARAAASQVDADRKAGKPLGALAGVPFTVKESLDVAGAATTLGVPALKNAIAAEDAIVVERLRRAGAIPIAHTNLPDLSLRFHTSSQLYGATINPWDSGRSPGGSSGGDGVAVGTGMAPIALGTDAGGSVRLPAAFAGVTALKPGFGRLPSLRGPSVTLATQLFPVDGPLARSVGDLRAVFPLLAGPDTRDPRVADVELWPPVPKQPMRVGLVVDPDGQGVDPAVKAAVEQAAKALASAGYEVEPVELPHAAEALDLYGRMILTEFNLIWPRLSALLQPNGQRYIKLFMDERKPATLEEYVGFTARRFSIMQEWAELFDRFPVILGPNFTEQAVEPDFDVKTPESFRFVQKGMRLDSITSFMGVPSVAVPAGITQGLPQSVQVIGRPYREDLCLLVAETLEKHFGRITPIDPRGK